MPYKIEHVAGAAGSSQERAGDKTSSPAELDFPTAVKLTGCSFLAAPRCSSLRTRFVRVGYVRMVYFYYPYKQFQGTRVSRAPSRLWRARARK